MTTIILLNSSFKIVVDGNTPQRGPKRPSQFITQYRPTKAKNFGSVRRKFQFKSSPADKRLSLSRQMENLVSYVESGSVENALQLFDEMTKRNSFVWNYFIRVLTNNGFFEEVIYLYHQMCIEGVQADHFTFPFLIKACGECLDLVMGRKVHSNLFKNGLILNLHISNSLILMYAKLGYIGCAEKVFDEMPVKDLISWNSMINGYILVGDGLSSLMCVRKIKQYGMRPDRITIMSALNASSLVRSLPNGKEIHALVIRSQFEYNEKIQTSLIDMYAKCGRMCYAERVFTFTTFSQRYVTAWNALIHGYGLNNQPLKSFSCFRKMQENGVNPNNVSLINLLRSCSQVGSTLAGKTIHGYAIRMGFLPHIVLDSALIHMYGKCGKPRLADQIYNRMHKRNLISRNTLITSLVRNTQYKDALKFFQDIWNEGFKFKPDAMTITGILPAYSEIGQLLEVKQIHSYIIKSGFCANTIVLNSLIYTYAKCGDLLSAQDVFDGILLKDVVSWNTIIMAYAIHGYGDISVDLFNQMIEKGIKPNPSTFVSLLSSCSVSGMVEEGWKYFILMKTEYAIDPCIEHYGCMIDLLGRIGDLTRAKELITKMPLEPTSRIWGSLLNASRRHKDLELAEFAKERILALEHDNLGLYILLSNLYAETGRWEGVRRIKSLMESQRLTKTVGFTMVEVKGKTFKFTNHDRSNEHGNLMIYDVLDIILKNPYGVLCRVKPVDFLRKRSKSTDWHSVRLAVCFGLISTSIRKPVFVRKNVRICEDCHDAMKTISLICGREIVVGDSKIYHHFRHGQCSCRDYW